MSQKIPSHGPESRRGKLRDEEGSIFVITMMVLGILTIVGLSLAVVTETEMMLGANEWVVAETHFAAEAGLSAQISSLLVSQDTFMVDFVTRSHFGWRSNPNFLGFDVKSSCLMPILVEPLAYSKANAGAVDRYYSGYYYTKVRAERVSWPATQQAPSCDDMDTVNARKYIVSGFFYGPMGELSGATNVNWERCGVDVNDDRVFDAHCATAGDGSANDFLDN